jgi:hypothetical protein
LARRRRGRHRVRACQEAIVAGFVGPQRNRTGEDRGDGKRPEIAAVETVGDGRVHQEDLARRKRVAAAPAWQRPAEMIAVLRGADIDMIDADGVVGPADRLSAQCHDVFQERHALR